MTHAERKLAYNRAWRLRKGIKYRGPRQILADGLKFCPKCGEIKELSLFPVKGKHADGRERYGYCKPCHVVYQSPIARRINLRKFGLTEAQYDEMLEMQRGVCAVCGFPPKTRRLAVDHDHKTGRVRCLACYNCNRNRLGTNTPQTARKVLELITSTFDGRLLCPTVQIQPTEPP